MLTITTIPNLPFIIFPAPSLSSLLELQNMQKVILYTSVCIFAIKQTFVRFMYQKPNPHTLAVTSWPLTRIHSVCEFVRADHDPWCPFSTTVSRREYGAAVPSLYELDDVKAASLSGGISATTSWHVIAVQVQKLDEITRNKLHITAIIQLPAKTKRARNRCA